MKFVITADATQLDRQFKAIAGMASAVFNGVDVHARACLYHAVMHNQPKPINDLVGILKHDQSAMNKWAVKHGPFVWQKGDKKSGTKAGLVMDEAKRKALWDKAKAEPENFTAWLKGIERFDEAKKINADPEPFSTYAKIAAIVRELDKMEKPENAEKKAKADLRGAAEIRGLFQRLRPAAQPVQLTH